MNEEEINKIDNIEETEKIELKYTPVQNWLVLIALIIAVLCDRLVIASIFWPGNPVFFFTSIFWIIYLIVFYGYNWERLRCNWLLWVIAGFACALCVWNLIFDYRSDYGIVTWFVIPGVLMVHAQYINGNFTLKQVGALALEWFRGWFVKPFSAIPKFFGIVLSLDSSGKKATLKKILIGVFLALPLLLIILPLLSGADMVFGYYLESILIKFNLSSFLFHAFVVCAATLLFFSFLWNIRFTSVKQGVYKKKLDMDIIISSIVLGIILATYVLFCGVQFTYLFAGAGLPNGLTYSEYAREGFWQLIIIAGINLFIFGIVLQYTKKNKIITIMLNCLLVLTAFILISGFKRLALYISNYGMTWLRLLSAWFIIYLAAVLILCAVRLVKEKLPLMVVCGIMLLGWYTILGYSNPDGFIAKDYLRNNPELAVSEDIEYLTSLSDDATIALLESGIENNIIKNIAEKKKQSANLGYSISSFRARRLINKYLRDK